MVLARGDEGLILAGYQLAARVAPWALDVEDDHMGTAAWQVSASLVAPHPVWMASRPHRLALRMGQRWWVFDQLDEEALDVGLLRGSGRPVITTGPTEALTR